MKKVRVPLRLMKQVREEKAFWVLPGSPRLRVGDRVGLQHPSVYEDGPCYAVVEVVDIVEVVGEGFPRLSRAEGGLKLRVEFVEVVIPPRAERKRIAPCHLR